MLCVYQQSNYSTPHYPLPQKTLPVSAYPASLTAGVPFGIEGTTNILRVAPCDERQVYGVQTEME